MIGDWEIALREIGGNPNLTFIYFVGFVLIGVLGVRFGVYALWNRRASQLPSQASIWTHLAAVGATAALYGLIGILEIVLPAMPSLRRSVLLAFVFLLALTMRLIARQGTPQDEAEEGSLGRPAVLALSLVVFAMVVAEAVGLAERLLAGVAGIGAILFATYGYWHGRRQLSRSMVQGTMLDTLLRHLLPVLTFGAFVPAIELVIFAGIDQAIVRHVQIVFVIMTATALMTANIKLRQNLARL